MNVIPSLLCWSGEPVYFGFPEDGALVLKHVEILYVLCDYFVVLCAFVGKLYLARQFLHTFRINRIYKISKT